jgi:hypothetical protein
MVVTATELLGRGDDKANVLNGWGHDNGSDILTDNGRANIFVFSGGRVTITDFNHSENDEIDLSFSISGRKFLVKICRC